MPLADSIRKMIREQISVEVMRVLEEADDPGRVTLDDGSGNPFNDVPCLASYTPRDAGDQVSVLKIGNSWLVLGANGKDPSATMTEDQVADMIRAAIPDVPPAGSSITYGSSAPTGTGWLTGSTVYVRDDGSGARSLYVQTSGGGTPTPPPPPPDGRPKTVTITPDAAGSWRSNGQTSGSVLQGNASAWGGSSAYWTGALFYGTKIRDACSGRTVSSMKLTVGRASGTGWNAKTPVRVGTHHRQNKNSVTSLNNVYTGTKLAWGGSATFELSSAIKAALASGDDWGLGITDTGSKNYMKLTGNSGKITITFA